MNLFNLKNNVFEYLTDVARVAALMEEADVGVPDTSRQATLSGETFLQINNKLKKIF